MIRFFAVAVAIAAITMSMESSAQAQGYIGGYQFGTGVQAAGLNGFCNQGIIGFRGFHSRAELPYFAQFPPVYYSGIVKRPYGISPFAAPAGIPPVEMNFQAPNPVSIKNPFFRNEVQPAKVAPVEEKESKTANKSARIVNPHIGNFANKQ